jgi:hypothetical protein
MHVAGTRVLGRVGESLRHREVRGHLDRFGHAPRQVNVCPGGHRGIQGERAQGIAQAAFGEDRGIDPGHQGPQFSQGPGRVLPGLSGQRHRSVRVGPDQPLRGP